MRALCVRVGLVVAALLPTTLARAWCQSANVQAPMGSCAQRCPEPSDAGGGPFVPLRWDDRDLTWVLQRDGSRDLTRELVIAVTERSFRRWTGVRCGERGVAFEVSFNPTPHHAPVSEYIEFVVLEENENQVLFDGEWVAHDHDPRAFALTSTHYLRATGELVDVDTELNEESWAFAFCPAEGCDDGRVDLESTMMHEVGHFFGLAHTPDSESATMWACAEPGEVDKRELEADDVEGMCALYEGRLEGGCGCAAPGLGGATSALGVGFGGASIAVLGARRRRRRR